MGQCVRLRREKTSLTFFDNDKDAYTRMHPDGTVRAQLPDGDELHIWHPDVPRAHQYADIYSQDRRFVLTPLVGTLICVEHLLVEGDDHHLHRRIVNSDGYFELIKQREYYGLQHQRFIVGREGINIEMPVNPFLYREIAPLNDVVIAHVHYQNPVCGTGDKVMLPIGAGVERFFDPLTQQETALSIYGCVKSQLDHFAITKMELHYGN